MVLQTGPGAIKMNSPVSPARMPAGGASRRTRQLVREKIRLINPTNPPIRPAATTRMISHHEPLADSAWYCSCQRLMSALANKQAHVVINSANDAIGNPPADRCGDGSAFESVNGIELRKLLGVDDLAVGPICQATQQTGRDIIGNKMNRSVAKGKIHAGSMAAGEAANRERRCRIPA